MADPMPSWREGEAKTAILQFVAAVTTAGSPDFTPEGERIAVFDNDGTLWCEQPAQAQVLFAQARAAELAAADPSLKTREPFRAFLAHDMAAIRALGKEGVMAFAFAVHAGMTVEAFDQVARDWLAQASHPIFKRPFTQIIYQPQLELLAFLRASGFKTFIVSGGGVDFMRAFAEQTYGVPPEQVIGSSVKLRFDPADDGPCQVTKLAELNSFDDREVKVQNIALHIGRRPILAFGNSDGDLAMMRYTVSGPGRRLALLLHHDDAAREVAYDREFRLSPLAEALDHADRYGLRVVSMARDWGVVFPPQV
ncbi:HAD family hydrolase [Phenylobacterium sp. LjRoot219]|uniref:HAD family hydrolase n=1 Tax=Phenylobacterium sp. LjRoot219 TaxID=3342283 RepID=UPI003ED01960